MTFPTLSKSSIYYSHEALPHFFTPPPRLICRARTVSFSLRILRPIFSLSIFEALQSSLTELNKISVSQKRLNAELSAK